MLVIRMTSNNGSGANRSASGLLAWANFASVVVVKLAVILMICVGANGQTETGQISVDLPTWW